MNNYFRFKQGSRIYISLVIILIITGFIYSKSVSFGLVNWDDEQNIRNDIHYTNLDINNLKYHYHHARYKALAIWSLMVDRELFTQNAGKNSILDTRGFHIHNIFLHLINIIMVFLIFRRITKNEIITLTVVALFALHPVFIEPVAWVTGRKDLLFLLFSLLSLWLYSKYLSNKAYIGWLVAVALFAYLASLAKIHAFTLPILMLILDWYTKRKISSALILEKMMLFFLIADLWIIFFLLLFIYLIIFLFKTYNINKWNIPPTFLFWYLLIFLFFIFGFSTRFFTLKEPDFWIPLIALVIYIIIFAYVLKNKSKLITKLSKIKISKRILLVVAPAIVLLSELYIKKIPYDFTWFHLWNNHPDISNYFSLYERLILAPNTLIYYVSRFFLILAQNPMVSYPARNPDGGLPAAMILSAIIVYIIFVFGFFLFFTYIRKNRLVIFGLLWFLASISIVLQIIPIEGRVLAADRYAYPSYIGLFIIFGSVIEFLIKKINKAIVLAGMACICIILSIKTYYDTDTWKNSKSLWEKALMADPENHYAMYSLGMALFEEDNRSQEALKYLNKAIQLKEDFQYYNNRGRIRYALHDFYGALADINKSISLDSNNFAAYNNRGILQQQSGNFKKALSDFNKAIRLKSDFKQAINNRHKIIKLIAIDSLVSNNLYIPPENHSEVKETINQIAQIYINRKEFDKAAQYLLKEISLEPDDPILYEKLAVLYQYNRNYEKSLEIYNTGLSFLPGNPPGFDT